MPGLIQASTAYDRPATRSPLDATCERMIREQIPNLFRPFVNPFVAQACYCLTRFIAEAWPGLVDPDDYQVFLANSGEEALSGAIKLARYAANAEGSPTGGLILDPQGRFEHFAFTELAEHGRLEFIPGIELTRDPHATGERLADPYSPLGFVVVPHESLRSGENPLAVRYDAGPAAHRPLLIVCTEKQQLACDVRTLSRAPDIVVFDDSFVNRDVPFGAFAATKRLYRHWNKRGMTTFHSTTFQPNTISTLHLVNCLRESAPEFLIRHQAALQQIEDDPQFRYQTFRDLYSRSLAKVASAVRAADGPVRASGHYVSFSGKRVFDGVAGVACSVRGHNPASFVTDLQEAGEPESWREELSDRLTNLTGLPWLVPAISGASAVEQALKIGLASQFPYNYVLALRGGFGGKTLFALTGTWKSTLKTGLAPLYPHVVYVDPFSDHAVEELESAFRKFPIGVVQLELVQGVGGVRPVPAPVLQRIVELRRKTDCLLFVDEIQTGMFRTGPFVRSTQLGLRPDLLTIGKGTSDMMFPFAMTLYSDAVQQLLKARDCLLSEAIRSRYDYETGLRTVLNTLRRAEATNLPELVRHRSELFAGLLRDALDDCRLVRDVRCFGLLIGIELDAQRWPHRWLKKLVYQLYLLSLLNDRRFPLLVGFCQYEPNVLKLTPPLSVTEDEIRNICATLSRVLRRSLSRVALSGLLQMTSIV